MRERVISSSEMRVITLIVVHCSAVRPGQRSSAADIDLWHKQRGWKGIGYHYVVLRDGTIENGRSIKEVGAHCYPLNRHSIGICYEGGQDANGIPNDTRTPEQKRALRQLLEELHGRFPKALIVGHRDLTHDRDCPYFDVIPEFIDIQPK